MQLQQLNFSIRRKMASFKKVFLEPMTNLVTMPIQIGAVLDELWLQARCRSNLSILFPGILDIVSVRHRNVWSRGVAQDLHLFSLLCTIFLIICIIISPYLNFI